MQNRNELQIKSTALRDLKTDIARDLIVDYVIDHLLETEVFTEEDEKDIMTAGHILGDVNDLAVRDHILFLRAELFIDRLCERMQTIDFAFNNLIYILMSEGHYPWIGRKILNRVVLIKQENERLALLQQSTSITHGPLELPHTQPLQHFSGQASGQQTQQHSNQRTGGLTPALREQQFLSQLSAGPQLAPTQPMRQFSGETLQESQLLRQLSSGIESSAGQQQEFCGEASGLQSQQFSQRTGSLAPDLREQQFLSQLSLGPQFAAAEPCQELSGNSSGSHSRPHLGRWISDPGPAQQENELLGRLSAGIGLSAGQQQQFSGQGSGLQTQQHPGQWTGGRRATLQEEVHLEQLAAGIVSSAGHTQPQSVVIGSGSPSQQCHNQGAGDRRPSLQEEQLLRRQSVGMASGSQQQQFLHDVDNGQTSIAQTSQHELCVHTSGNGAMRVSSPHLYNPRTNFSGWPSPALYNYGNNRYFGGVPGPEGYGVPNMQSFGGFPVWNGFPNVGPFHRFGALPYWGPPPPWYGMPAPGMGGSGPVMPGPGWGGYGYNMGVGPPGMHGFPPYPYVVFQCIYFLPNNRF